MTEIYTRKGSGCLAKESIAGTPVSPTTFFEFQSENLTTNYDFEASNPVAGNRSINIRPVFKAIPAITGGIKLSIEPEKFGNFLNSTYAALKSGKYLGITSISGTFTVGETVTGGTSSATGVVVWNANNEALSLSTVSGTFAAAETVTGGTSGATATVTLFNASVYAHVGILPADPLPSYTVQFNYIDNAIRYGGVRFNALDALAQKNNIFEAEFKVYAQWQFRHSLVTAVTTSGSGTKVIPCDQTLGLLVGDIVKIFRPGTGFIDLNGSGVKTNTITAIVPGVSISISVLTTATLVNDIIELAPSTPTYVNTQNMAWVGAGNAYIGNTLSNIAANPIQLEDFTLSIMNAMEGRNGVSGTGIAARFPTAILQKGLTSKGSFKIFHQDENWMSKARQTLTQALRILATGGQIASTGINYSVSFTFSDVRFKPFQTELAEDAIIEDAVSFEGFYNATAGYQTYVLLITDVSSF